jgi:hypothetical protein
MVELQIDDTVFKIDRLQVAQVSGPPDALIARMLRSFIPRGGFGPTVPDGDLEAAKKAARAWQSSGLVKIIKHVPPPVFAGIA